MRHGPRPGSLVCLSLLSTSVLAGQAKAEGRCDNRYEAPASREIVTRRLEHDLGADLDKWDLERPLVKRQRGQLRLTFAMKPNPNLLDCPYYLVVFDPCRRAVVSAELLPWDVALGLRQGG